jgi:hypothetical protein
MKCFYEWAITTDVSKTGISVTWSAVAIDIPHAFIYEFRIIYCSGVSSVYHAPFSKAAPKATYNGLPSTPKPNFVVREPSEVNL